MTGTALAAKGRPGEQPSQDSCETLRKLWRTVFVPDFKIQWTDGSSLACGSNDMKLAMALNDLRNLRFHTSASGPQRNLYGAVKKWIRKTVYDRECPFYATGRAGTLTICPEYFQQSREVRAVTVFHEARHMQPDDPKHAECVRGPNANYYQGCNQDFWNGALRGSGYNAEVFFFNAILTAGYNHSLRREVMQAEMRDLIPDHFNNITHAQIKEWRK